MNVCFEYQLIGSGWAQLELTINQQYISIYASYLHDALADVLQATLSLLDGQQQAKAYVRDEPNEYRWCFSVNGQQLTITVWQFDQCWSNKANDKGNLLFQETCRLHTFAGALLAACQKLSTVYSPEAYRKIWKNHDLPVQLIQQLQHHSYRQ